MRYLAELAPDSRGVAVFDDLIHEDLFTHDTPRFDEVVSEFLADLGL